MNNYKFSAKTNSFYPESLREYYEAAGTLPDDLIDVSDEVYSIFSAQPPEGKVRGNKVGEPVWVKIPPPTEEELKANALNKKNNLMSFATAAIAPLQDANDLEMASNDELLRLKEWKKYRALLNRVDVNSKDIDWPVIPS
jgi:hypothetical protein